MVTFAQQTITKKVLAQPLSKMTLCWVILWGFAFIFPVLYLVSIGSQSWPLYTNLSQLPHLQYKNYEISCSGNAASAFYYTNLDGKTAMGTNTPSVTGGFSEQDNVGIGRIKIQLRDTNISSCSGILYFVTTLKSQIYSQFVGAVPFSLSASSNYLSDSTISADVSLNSVDALPQNYISSSQPSTPFNGSFYPTMEDNFLKTAQNPLSLRTSNQLVEPGITPSSVNPTITFSLTVQIQRIRVNGNLLSQMREFFRQWVYVFVPVSWLVLWTIQKLVKTRIYDSRVGKASPKLKIL